MTSEQNKLLPILKPKQVIGIKRRPNRRDLYNRRDPDGQQPLQGLPDPDADVALRRAAMNLGQAAVNIQQTILEMDPVSAIRGTDDIPLNPIMVEELDEEDAQALEDALDAVGSEDELDDEGERAVEDAFIAKVRGVGVEAVRAVRKGPVLTGMQAFVKKVRTVKGRGPNVPAAADAVVPAAAAEPVVINTQPGTTRELTVAEAALALTNGQAGTNVMMEDLRTEKDVEYLQEDDDGDKYRWTVGNVNTRELTVAEAALVLTNLQAGTNVTMEDLRTAREMVDLWDNEDTFQWTVGNVE